MIAIKLFPDPADYLDTFCRIMVHQSSDREVVPIFGS